MKKTVIILFVAIVAMVGSAYTFQSIINWKIDNEKAMVKFTLQAHGKELVGNFKGAKGEVKFDEKDLAGSNITCTVDVSTINTGIEGRDKHLQAAEFFDAAGFPELKFTSTKIEKTATGYMLTGNLQAKGVSKEVSAPFSFVQNGSDASFQGSFPIKRSDYKIGKEGADPSDEVLITFDIPVTKE